MNKSGKKTMIIEHPLFGPNYRIQKDRHQYAVQERQVVKGKNVWVSETFPSTLGGAVNTIINFKVLDEHDRISLRMLVEEYQNCVEQIRSDLKF